METIQISPIIFASYSVSAQNVFVGFYGEVILFNNEVHETLLYMTTFATLTNTRFSNALYNMLLFKNKISFFGNRALVGLVYINFFVFDKFLFRF